MSVIQLPFVSWGDPHAPKKALLVHGLGSDAHTMWQFGEHFANSGWHAVAVDQRGHGTAPRTHSYRIDDYALDLLAVPSGRPWSLVIGHSIGGANVVRSSAIDPTWASALVLIDPALATTAADRAEISARQVDNHRNLTVERQASLNPHWHPLDIELSVSAQRNASEFALVRSVEDNHDWDVLDEASALTVPTLVFQGDPAVMARYTDNHAATLEGANPLISRVTIAGVGHNVHRDEPAQLLAALNAWLAD